MQELATFDLWCREVPLEGYAPCLSPIQGFREDDVRVAHNREPGQQLKQIAADFGINESYLTYWSRKPMSLMACAPG